MTAVANQHTRITQPLLGVSAREMERGDPVHLVARTRVDGTGLEGPA